jgi:hypothetical protein
VNKAGGMLHCRPLCAAPPWPHTHAHPAGAGAPSVRQVEARLPHVALGGGQPGAAGGGGAGAGGARLRRSHIRRYRQTLACSSPAVLRLLTPATPRSPPHFTATAPPAIALNHGCIAGVRPRRRPRALHDARGRGQRRPLQARRGARAAQGLRAHPLRRRRRSRAPDAHRGRPPSGVTVWRYVFGWARGAAIIGRLVNVAWLAPLYPTRPSEEPPTTGKVQ